MDLDLEMEVLEQQGASVLVVHGQIDVHTAPRLREQLVELVTQGARRIVVDLNDVDFLDSTGLGVLVGVLKRVRTHDGELVLACQRPRVLKVFEITGLTSVFPIHLSVDDATA